MLRGQNYRALLTYKTFFPRNVAGFCPPLCIVIMYVQGRRETFDLGTINRLRQQKDWDGLVKKMAKAREGSIRKGFGSRLLPR